MAEEEKIIDDEGHFHVHDEAVDLSDTIAEGWVALAIFWLLGADGLLPVRHPLRAERLGGLDRGGRALHADRRRLRRRDDRRGEEQPDPGRLLLPLPAGGRRPLAGACGRRAAHRLLRRGRADDGADDAEDRQPDADDDRRCADEHRLRRLPVRLRRDDLPLDPGGADPLAPRLQRPRAPDDDACRPRGMAPRSCVRCPRGSAAPFGRPGGRCDAEDHLPALHEQRPAGGDRHGGRFARLHPDLRQPAAVRRHPPDGERHRQLPAAGGAVLHPRRQPDEQRRHHDAHLQLRARPGRLAEGRARPRQRRRLGDLRRHERHRDRRRRRARHDRDQGDEGARLLDRVRGRRDRGVGDARADHPAEPAVRDLRDDGQRLGRRALPRRHPARRADGAPDDADGRLLRAQERLGRRHQVLGLALPQGDGRARPRHRLAAAALGGRQQARRAGAALGASSASRRCSSSTGSSASRRCCRS